jgi:hypothetical protein
MIIILELLIFIALSKEVGREVPFGLDIAYLFVRNPGFILTLELQVF